MSESARVFAALLAVFTDSTFTASDVMTRIRLTGAPKTDELRRAFESATESRKLGVIKLGHWLSKHRDKQAGGLWLSAEYDAHFKRWRYYVAPETDRASYLAAPAKKPHGKKAYHERERAYREQERQRESEKCLPKKYYLLVPSPGSRQFQHEPTATSVARHARELGFDADVINSPGGGFLVQVFDVDRAEADAIAKKLRRSVVESETQPSRQWNSVVYDAKRNIYVPKATAGTAAVPHDPALRIVRQMFATNDADRKPRQGLFNWSPFNLKW